MKKIGIILVIIGTLLIFVSFFVGKEKNNNKSKKDEVIKINGGVLPLCSKDSLDELDYEDNNNNIIFTNENYATDEDGNRKNISENLKKDHEFEGIIVKNTTITSKRCFEKSATLSAVVINNTDTDIENKMLHFVFNNENQNYTNDIGIVIDIKAGEKKEINNEYNFRIIDATDFKIYIDTAPEPLG